MSPIKLIVAIAFISFNYFAYHSLASGDIIPERENFADFPDEIDGWECQKRGEMDQDILDNLGVTDYIICRYAKQSEEGMEHVDFYAGYHESQQRSDSGKTTMIHPPEHCLPGSGWDIIETSIVPINFGIKGEAKRVVIAKGSDRSLVYFWYQSRGHVIGTNFGRLFHMFWDRALRSRTDGALLRFTMPIARGQEDESDDRFRRFATVMMADMPRWLPN